MAVPYTKTVEELAAALEQQSYTPRTDEELRQQAENIYRNQRDTARLNAQMQYDTAITGLDNQAATLDTTYDRQRESQLEANLRSLSNADRAAQMRGMGRSSYNLATQANLRNAGDKAMARIEEDRANALVGIANQRDMYGRQLAQSLASADSTFENSVIAKIQELANQDYDRKTAATNANNNSLMQLYQLLQTDNKNKKTSSSSSGNKSGTNPVPDNNGNNQNGSNWRNTLFGNGTAPIAGDNLSKTPVSNASTSGTGGWLVTTLNSLKEKKGGATSIGK